MFFIVAAGLSPTDITPPEGSGAWWSMALLIFTLVGGAVSAVWSAWVAFKNKRYDLQHQENERRLEAERVNQEKRWEIELKKLQLDFDRQRDFQNDLIKQLGEEKNYTRELMATNRELAATVMERDQKISEKDAVIFSLERKIVELERKIDQLMGRSEADNSRIEELTRHVKSLESKSGHKSDEPPFED